MTDPAAFVLARIAEREAVARKAADVAASPWRWEHLPPPLEYGLVGAHPIQGYGTVIIIPSRSGDMWPNRDTADHIALNDPATVLARCAVDRQIVEELVSLEQEVRDVLALDLEAVPVELDARRAATYRIVRLLASLDADHPNYDKDWKP